MATGSDDITEIVQNVVANERLYENIELVIQERYRWIGPSDDPGYLAGMPLLAADGDARYVYQDGMVYHQAGRTKTMFSLKQGMSTPPQGLGAARDTTKHVTAETSFTLGYDGERTRCVDGTVANIHLGRFVPPKLVRPHSLIFLGEPFVIRPLSEYLTAMSIADCTHELVYEGQEQCENLNCVRLRSNLIFQSDAEPDFGILWLAVDRNYLPVRQKFYVPAYSRSIPLTICTMGDFRELSPGVWLAFSQTHVKYGEIAASQGKVVPHSRTDHTVTKAQLDPQYDISLFRDVKIPDGMQVIEIKESPKGKDYTVVWAGTPPPERWSWWWVLVLAGVIFGAYVIWRRRSMVSKHR